MKFLKKLFFKPTLSPASQKKLMNFLDRAKHFSEEEISMIYGVVSIKEFTARDVMIPRVDVSAFPVSIKQKELEKILSTSYHSRFPIYDQNIDDIKGVVHIRDIFQYLFFKEYQKDKQWLVKRSKEPYFIPESRLLLDILRDLQKAHIQMAIVVDEYGGFSGIITMEDILEEIIGDVQDESDEEMKEIIQLEPQIYSVDARMDLDLINDQLETDFIDEHADTIGGYLVNLFGRIPKKNQSIDQGEATFTVMTKKGNSITRVKINLTEKKPSSMVVKE